VLVFFSVAWDLAVEPFVLGGALAAWRSSRSPPWVRVDWAAVLRDRRPRHA
jgi:hypothetical protein